MIKKIIKKAKLIFFISFTLLALRFILLPFYPLMDRTEARYAEISREMIEAKNWVTPLLEEKPFWAKPPLSMWAVNISYKLFGLNEFGARFSSMAFSLLSLLFGMILVYLLSKKNKLLTAIFTFIFSTCSVVFLLMAGVMTDLALLFCITMAMTSFMLLMKTGNKNWNYPFFIGIGLSLLAKGPIGLIFILVPIFLWILILNDWKNIFCSKKIFFIRGFFIVALISVPWYIFAEKRTPGFLNYFFIGEHFYRYTMKGWKGDLYGNPSSRPFGFIWVYFIIGFFPWIIFFVNNIFGFLKKLKTKIYLINKYYLFLFLWMIFPIIFFCLSKNILISYILPSTVPFCVLTAIFIYKKIVFNKIKLKNFLIIGSVIPSILILAIIIVSIFPSLIYKNTQKYLVKKYDKNICVFLYERPHYSARFYTDGKLKYIEKNSQLYNVFDEDKSLENYVFIIDNDEKYLKKINKIPELSVIDNFANKYLVLKYKKLK
jgi:4-amino-4-deoxy-L-arabinose transferase-like glycosyltransferase